MADYSILFLGIPTWDFGEIQTDWANNWDVIDEVDLSGKIVALFGLGDQASYSDAFVDALGELYDIISETGASVVGFWPNEGYEFNSSNALDGDDFVGLVIDQDNQSSLTPERVKSWVSALKSEFAL